MANRYTEVLMTYVRRPFSSWQAALWAAFILWTVFSDGFGHPGHIGTGPVIGGGVLLGLWIWLHFREQMVHPRRTITPHYASTSIAVFVALGLLTIAGPPLMLSLKFGFRAGLFFALAVYVFGLVGWAVAANSFLVMILCAAAFFSPLGYLFGSFPSPRHWAAPPCLLAAGLVAGIWAIWRLSHITEDHRGYGHLADEGPAFLGRAAGHLFGLLLGPAKSVHRVNEQESRITYGTPLALDGTLRDTLRRWRHTGWPALYLSPAIFVLCYFTSLAGYRLVHPSSKAIWEFQVSGLFIFLWIIVLPLVVLLRWRAAWSCMAVESLRPESRAGLIRGTFLTLAFQILLAWLLIATTVWLASVIASHTMTGMAPLTLYLLATGMLQPVAYAAVCWLLPWGSPATYFAFAAVEIAGVTTTFSYFGPVQAIGVTAVLMALGLVLIPLVYCHWLNMEMG